MEHSVLSRLADSLKQGQLPPADPRELDGAVQAIADELVRPGKPAAEVRNAMKALNGQRQFPHMRTLGQAWTDCQAFDATIVRRYAQALIELFELDPAEALLGNALPLARSGDADAKGEIPELLGLLGRIEKQRFVKTGNKQSLIGATNRYLVQLEETRESDNWFWHSINAIALAAREQRERVAPPDRKTTVPQASQVYQRMVQLYEEAPDDDPWVPATASEAALALRKCDDAELWLYRFLHHPAVEPFNVQSYDRQLREIWQGQPTGAGTRCADRLARIMARHLMRTQSQLTVSISAVPALKRKVAEEAARAVEKEGSKGLEKNFLGESTFSLANIRDMLDACSSVGCVTNKTGARLGTGFLIDGAWLGFGSAGLVFVTNAHVISDQLPKAILPDNARVMFEIESELAGTPVFYKIDRVLGTCPPTRLGTSSDGALDFTVVTLRSEGQAPGQLKALKPAACLPLIEKNAKAYVVGHPLGSGLQISLHDSVLLDIDDAERLVHYRTPTDPGSSGSPVFNTEWEVIGLHHGGSEETPRLHGSGNYEANEAISLLSIRKHLEGRVAAI
jgi:hypothetical protein